MTMIRSDVLSTTSLLAGLALMTACGGPAPNASDGALQLDRPVNEVLQSWKVPDNEFTEKTPVTLRHVMTHQAGFTPFSYLIRRSDALVPGMAELLRGGIHDWPMVTVEFEPGSRHAYSNAGYCVLQLLLEDHAGLSLHDLATKPPNSSRHRSPTKVSASISRGKTPPFGRGTAAA